MNTAIKAVIERMHLSSGTQHFFLFNNSKFNICGYSTSMFCDNNHKKQTMNHIVTSLNVRKTTTPKNAKNKNLAAKSVVNSEAKRASTLSATSRAACN